MISLLVRKPCFKDQSKTTSLSLYFALRDLAALSSRTATLWDRINLDRAAPKPSIECLRVNFLVSDCDLYVRESKEFSAFWHPKSSHTQFDLAKLWICDLGFLTWRYRFTRNSGHIVFMPLLIGNARSTVVFGVDKSNCIFLRNLI